MKLLKQSLIILFISSILIPAYANQTTIPYNQTKSEQIFNWEFHSLDDGMIFLLGPESTKKLEISVNGVTNNKSPDSITVYCNATMYHVGPGNMVTCYGNFSDVISMYIAPEDFKNGSKGIYQYKPWKA